MCIINLMLGFSSSHFEKEINTAIVYTIVICMISVVVIYVLLVLSAL